MPWHGLTRVTDDHQNRRRLLRFVEAAASTVGPVAHQAGFAFNDASTGQRGTSGQYLSLADDADSPPPRPFTGTPRSYRTTVHSVL